MAGFCELRLRDHGQSTRKLSLESWKAISFRMHRPAALQRILCLNGGKVTVRDIGMYTPAGSPLGNFAVLWNAVSVQMEGFNDLSGNITGPLFGGSTSGLVVEQ